MRRLYTVKAVYATLQGEGARTGRPAVFCRFAGCNLWSGLEADRAASVCWFCDTDFVGTDGPGGGRYGGASALAAKIEETWDPSAEGPPYVVFTGGEPLLQLDAALVAACHARGFKVAVETNGTIPVPPGVDWITVSPKPGSPWAQKSGDELKLLYPLWPDPEAVPAAGFRHRFVQPVDGPDLERNTRLARDWCEAHPRWRLSLQTHKLLGIP